MKLGTLLLRLLVPAVIAAAAAQWWLLRESQAAAQRAVAQWQAYGALHYERLWMQLWGTAHLWNVSFEPGGLTQAWLGSPFGYRISAREVLVRNVERGDDGALQGLRLQLRGLRVPVIDSFGGDPRRPIGFAELGYRELLMDVDLDLRLVESTRLVLAKARAEGPQLAALELAAEIQASAEQLRRAPDQIGLRRLLLDYRDRGLMERYKSVAAARLRLGPAAAEKALVAQLEQRAARRGWDADSMAALRGFIHNPSRLQLVLDPPGEVILRNLRLYAGRDWPQLLGVRLSLPPAGGEKGKTG